MKTSVLERITMWLAECGGEGSAAEAFAGDLLESLADGRSRWWCLSQALQRVAFLTELRLRALLVPVAYSVAFVLLFPMWQRLNAPAATRLLTRYNGAVDWPGSAVLEIVAGLMPAVLFVWAGTLGFLLLQRQQTSTDTVMRVMLSLSFGCSMVCAETMLRLGSRPPELRKLSHAGFYYPGFGACFSVMLFMALFAAVVLLPREHPKVPRRRSGRVFGRRQMLRLARGLGLTTLLVPHGAAQQIRPQGPAAKRLVQLIEGFDGQDWKSFHAGYVASLPVHRRRCRWETNGSGNEQGALIYASWRRTRRSERPSWCRSTVRISLHASALR